MIDLLVVHINPVKDIIQYAIGYKSPKKIVLPRYTFLDADALSPLSFSKERIPNSDPTYAEKALTAPSFRERRTVVFTHYSDPTYPEKALTITLEKEDIPQCLNAMLTSSDRESVLLGVAILKNVAKKHYDKVNHLESI